jgi:hypothetical protein
MSWAPSYRIDITDPKTLSIAQKAVIKNELEDMRALRVNLISGFPSVKFSHVTSPLSVRTNWAAFFQQLSQRPQPGRGASAYLAVGQQAVTMNAPAPAAGLDMSAIPTGEGVDLHYQPIGTRSLAEGESLALEVASAETEYERIVEWIVPDTRRPDGRHIQDYERRNNPEKYEDVAWDAIRFKNPFEFPMTTAPAMIVADRKFNGQCMSYWANSGERTVLHVTKALSIRTLTSEQEEKGKRETVYVGGDDYRKTTVKGTLSISNHRKEKITMVIRRRFSGELLNADRKPECELREEGVYSVNQRNELTWQIELKPGEEVKLQYQYAVLVNT